MRPAREWCGAQVAREPDLDGIVIGGELYRAFELLGFVDERMPHPHPVLAARDVRRHPFTVRIRPPEERRCGHDDVRQHVVVDVAAERDDARLLERNGWIGFAAI